MIASAWSGCYSYWSEWLCAVTELTSQSGFGLTEISVFSALKETTKGFTKGFHSEGIFQWCERPRVIARFSSVTIFQPQLLLLVQSTCFRGCLGNAIRNVSGFNKWEVPPRHPSDWRLARAVQRLAEWRIQWLIKVMSGSWPHCVPHAKKDPLTLQQSRILSQIPQIPNTQRRGPSAGPTIPREGRLFLSSSVALTTDRQMGLLYPKCRLFNNICFLSFTFFTHLILWI